jgi:Na+-translocating ferredoxin:NAD+ oxidoreductase RnfA subunit
MTDHRDERITATTHLWAARGLVLLMAALSIDLMVRTLILRQHPGQYLDIALIWMATTLYVAIGTTASGVEMHGGRLWKMWPIIPLVVVVNTLMFARLGMAQTLTDVAASVVSATVGFSLFIVIFRGIYARWERRTLGRGPREE